MRRFSPIFLGTFACLSFALANFPTTSAALSQAPRVPGPIKHSTSTNWSGYAVETNLTSPQSDVVTDVKGSWVVPTVTCSSTAAYSSAWVGIDGYSSNSVEQTGTDSDCSNGKGVYYAWYEMYPKASKTLSLAINAGDTINAEVLYNGSSSFTLLLTDATTGGSFSITLSSHKAARSSAEWIMEAPYSGGILPLANFGTAQFTNSFATLNGHTGTISDAAWQNDPISMVNSSGGTKDTVSNLGNKGTSFSVTWVSSN